MLYYTILYYTILYYTIYCIQGAPRSVPRWPHTGVGRDLAKAWVVMEVLYYTIPYYTILYYRYPGLLDTSTYGPGGRLGFKLEYETLFCAGITHIYTPTGTIEDGP